MYGRWERWEGESDCFAKVWIEGSLGYVLPRQDMLMAVLKTSGSSFEKFHRDELTTLPG